jgi:hypothetical protein
MSRRSDPTEDERDGLERPVALVARPRFGSIASVAPAADQKSE